MKDLSVKPYKKCKGFKWRRPKYWKNKYKPFVVKYSRKICNICFTEKNKIRFIQQFFRWFIKGPEGFKIMSCLKEPYTYKNSIYKINECDFIKISCRTYKAAWKKLLSRLNYEMIDYEKIRRRKLFGLYFTFFFSNLNQSNKEIMLDIICNKYNSYKIFIVLDAYYISHFKDIMENIKLWEIDIIK